MEPHVIAFLLVLSVLGGALALNQQPTGQLPPEARCYFDAVAAKYINALTKCFDAKAVIIDVDRRMPFALEFRLHEADRTLASCFRLRRLK